MSRLSCTLSAVFLITVGTALAACSTTLGTRAPQGVDLGGEWQIDLALSDFPQEAVPIQPAIGSTGDTTSTGGTGGRHGGRGRGMGGAPPGGGQAGGGRVPGSPEHHFAMPPHLAISQSATSLVVNATMQDGKHLTNS